MGKQRNWNHKLHQNNNVKENSVTTPRTPSPDCKEPQLSPTSAASKNRPRSLTHSSNNVVFHNCSPREWQQKNNARRNQQQTNPTNKRSLFSLTAQSKKKNSR